MAPRSVVPEILDRLAADDPEAIASRRDLRRLNRIMLHAPILAGRLRRLASTEKQVLRLTEIGAGDAAFMLSVARRLGRHFQSVELTVVDRAGLMTEARCEAFAAAGWTVNSVEADVFDWLEGRRGDPFDVTIANLFLHHFDDARLARLLGLVNRSSALFVALEPRRSAVALAASRLVGLIGANRVTRHDAPASVRAGFRAKDLSELWPRPELVIEEGEAGAFSHIFAARGVGVKP